jgi:hypothetical protein
MAFQTQEKRKITASAGCGENSVPSTMVRWYDFHEPRGYLGNLGSNILMMDNALACQE